MQTLASVKNTYERFGGKVENSKLKFKWLLLKIIIGILQNDLILQNVTNNLLKKLFLRKFFLFWTKYQTKKLKIILNHQHY